ncbi:Peptidase, partial [Oryctes borbonicus]
FRKMATSKFEPTYARQAYPCFDEPNMKANFTVHLLKPDDETYIALSNMPQVIEEPVENGIMVHFQESVRMSTYLSCFIVSDFDFTSGTLKNGQEFRVYATPEQIAKTEYARTIGISVIDYFTEFFDIDFPLPKLDMAAIPDFVSGAMEHWGLVTFRETALLYSSEISSSANKQRVASVVSHELAHSWFGNLVTMQWWNDIWLNEGFASYIQYKGVNYAEPDWQMMDQFIIDDLHPVLILDATLGSHPIVQTVLTPDEITAIFDTISYNKGAAVLRMLEDAVGELNFKNGVTKYLKDHEYENAVTQDLWDALQDIIEDEIDITEFMNTWTMQMGYPVIDVTTSTDGEEYILKQRRYLTNPDALDSTETPYNYRWTIPITYITSESDTPQYIWFNHTDTEVSIPKPAVPWIKFNYRQVGYYRVNYELADWERLIDNIGDLEIADQTHLLEEAFRLAESGDISYEIPLNLSLYMKNEDGYIPWSVMYTMLGALDVYLSSSADFRNYVQDIINGAYEKLSWAEEDEHGHITRRARVTVLSLACKMGHADCLEQATQRFEAWLNENEPLSQDLRTIVYNYGAAGSDAANWEKMYDIFVKESDAAEKLKLMHGLTFSNDPALLTRLIEIAETEEIIRGQDYFTLLQYIAANPIGTSIVWDYVREHWEQLVDRFGLNERYLGRMIPSITKTFTTNTKLNEMKDFFGKYPNAGAGASARV